jgi:putative FmdB family regulatory protein
MGGGSGGGGAVATYEYRCRSCGTSFAVSRAMGTATPAEPCPACTAESARVYTAPQLSLTDSNVRNVRAREEQSSDSPDVVTKLPGRPRPRQRAEQNPLWSRLPRP